MFRYYRSRFLWLLLLLTFSSISEAVTNFSASPGSQSVSFHWIPDPVYIRTEIKDVASGTGCNTTSSSCIVRNLRMATRYSFTARSYREIVVGGVRQKEYGGHTQTVQFTTKLGGSLTQDLSVGAGEYELISDLTVESGVTLNLNGTTVLASNQQRQITVKGNLNSTSVVFDGAGTNPSTAWSGIKITGGTATFQNSVIKRAGYNSNTISVSAGGYLDFQGSTIKDSGNNGIRFQGADSRLLVKTSKIENTSTGIRLYATNNVTIDSNEFIKTSTPIHIDSFSTQFPSIQNTTYTNTGKTGIQISSNQDVTTSGKLHEPLYVVGKLTIQPDVKLTLAAGKSVIFGGSRYSLEVKGELDAQSVVFDGIGNNKSNTWEGIRINGG